MKRYETKFSLSILSATLVVALSFSSAAMAADSDGDGLDDSIERMYGWNPYDANSPGETDTDLDGLTDLTEYKAYTNIFDENNPVYDGASDDDGDTLPKGLEVFLMGTDPDNPDTDGDALRDDVDPNPVSPAVGPGPIASNVNIMANGSISTANGNTLTGTYTYLLNEDSPKPEGHSQWQWKADEVVLEAGTGNEDTQRVLPLDSEALKEVVGSKISFCVMPVDIDSQAGLESCAEVGPLESGDNNLIPNLVQMSSYLHQNGQYDLYAPQPESGEIVSTSSAFAKIETDRSVIAWGNAANGGDASVVQSELRDVIDIYATKNAFAALRLDGSLVTWGSATYGGDSSTVQDQLMNIKTVYSTGSYNNSGAFAALKNDGTVVTWGSASYGGNSSAVQTELTGVTAIYANTGAFAALKK
ncbi:hypothetical protein HQQ94_07155 [Shewanella sp. VB17]|uniref:hypothetical protein n=1 Tax=Shewanella sp. VB17 TaxID=2739432 RepID=UPI001565162C|nr:hypothetical protein [Shewanella sp. VB17]NRD73020.1 hypothetical protein [Shewanella sp. VB17]